MSWEYDQNNRLSLLKEASRTYQYEYDEAGHLSKLIKPDDVILHNQIDVDGNLKKLFSSDGSIDYAYIYDPNGNLIAIDNLVSQRTTHHQFDKENNLTFTQQENGLTLRYKYPDLSHFEIVFPDNSSITYLVNSLVRKDPVGEIVYTQTFETQEGLLIEHAKGKQGTVSLHQDKNTIQISSDFWNEILSFDTNDQISHTCIQDPSGQMDQYFCYDDNLQLVSWKDSSGNSCEYVYDFLGNRIQENGQIYEVDSLNQTISKGSVKYTYDLNGNLISRQSEAEQTLFSYDPLDRLISIEIPSSSKIGYTYDGYHRRQTREDFIWDIKKNSWILVTKRNFLFIGNEEIGSFDERGHLIELRILYNGPLRGLDSTRVIELPSGNYYAIHDLQGNIRCLVDMEERKVKEYYRYSPFGDEEIYNEFSEKIDSKFAINPWRFSAKRTDLEGYVDFGKRFYMPEIGKWMTLDPLGYRDGHNRYVFVKNNPINFTDPLGYFSMPIWIGKLREKMDTLFQSLSDYLETYQKMADFDQNVADFVRFFVGKGLFSISNYYSEPGVISTFKGSSPSTKKGITFINGIMNSKYQVEQILEKISQWPEYQNEEIYFIYRGTGGWTKDIVKAAFIKFGYISDNAEELAKIWRTLLQEVDEIDHWAHSIGGTETLRARDLLTPEEQKRVNVISLGSSTVIPDVGFKSVINHMSYRDGVCYLDPIGFLHALIFKPSYVDFKGSFLDGFPGVDHLFAVYWKYLKEVIEKNDL